MMVSQKESPIPFLVPFSGSMLNFGRVLKSYGWERLSHLFILAKKKHHLGRKKTAGPTVGGNQKSGVENQLIYG